MKDLLAQQRCLKALREVMSAKMELSCDGWKFHERQFGSLELVIQSNEFGWVALDCLADRRKSVGTENGGGIGDDDIGVWC